MDRPVRSLPLARLHSLVSRRTVMGAGVGLAGTAILAACQAPAPTATAVPPPKPAAPAPAPTQAPAAAPTQAPAAAAPTQAPAAAATQVPAAAAAKPVAVSPNKIRFITWSQANHGNFAPMILAKAGVDISLEAWGGDQKLLTEIAAGTGPDLLMLDAYWQGDFFRRNVVADFDPYFKTMKLEVSRFSDDPYKENGYKGKLMGLSQFPGMEMGVWINMDMAEKAGIAKDLPVWGTPNYDKWKISDMLTWAKSAAKVTSDGKVEMYGWDAGFQGFGDPHSFFVYQNDGKFFDDPWNYESTKATLNAPENIDAFQPIVDGILKDKSIPDIDTRKAASQGGGLFVANRVMSTNSHLNPGSFREIRDKVKLKVLAFPYAKKPAHINMGNTLGINAASKFKDETAKWIVTFTTDDEIQMKKLGVPTPETSWIISSWDSLRYVNQLPAGLIKDVCLASLARIKGMSTVPQLTEGVNVFPRHYGGKGIFFRDTATAALERAQQGKETLKVSLDDANAKINAELAKGF